MAALLSNAAIDMPLLKEPLRSPEGYELTMTINYLGHFLLYNLMLDVRSSQALILFGTRTGYLRNCSQLIQ